MVLETRLLLYLFVLAYIAMYVFSGNPYQAHSLQHSYHPTQPFEQEKYNTKWKYMRENGIKLKHIRTTLFLPTNALNAHTTKTDTRIATAYQQF